MIIGHIDNLDREKYKLPESIRQGLEFILREGGTAADGRHEIDGDRIFALVQSYKTKPKRDCRPEVHEKYVDIQYVAEGREYLGYCALHPLLEVMEDCIAERDVKFFRRLVPESYIYLSQGSYAILYPHDVHQPCCEIDQAEPVKKIVVKISVELLDELGSV